MAVCVLGMALAMFSERLRREPDTPRTAQISAADTQLPNLAASNTPASTPEVPIREAPASQSAPLIPDAAAKLAEKVEDNNAREALAPPPGMPAPSTYAPTSPDTGTTVEKLAPSVTPAPLPAPIAPKPEAKPVEIQEKPVVAPPAPPAKASVTPPQTTPPAQPKSAAAKGGKINNFVVFARDNGATIRLGGDGKIKYTSMTLENPNRVVVDLDGNWEFPAKLPIPKNEMVNSVRVGKNGDKTRVVIDLKAKPRISRMVAGQNGSSVDVRVDK